MHVVNGDSVGGTLARSGLAGEIVVWRDVLHEGDVPPGDPETVRRARAAFLAGSGYGAAERILADLAAADEALVAALDDDRETVLWFEHDLHDQLQLIQILARIADHPRRAAARMITLDAFPGRPRFKGLGELSAEELVTLWPTARRDRGARLRHAPRARTLRSSTPTRTRSRPRPGALRRTALPPRRARGRLLEERPWSGPGARAQRAPDPARRRGRSAHARREIFLATTRMEEAPYSGDDWIYERIDELARRESPLLASTASGIVLTATAGGGTV